MFRTEINNFWRKQFESVFWNDLKQKIEPALRANLPERVDLNHFDDVNPRYFEISKDGRFKNVQEKEDNYR